MAKSLNIYDLLAMGQLPSEPQPVGAQAYLAADPSQPLSQPIQPPPPPPNPEPQDLPQSASSAIMGQSGPPPMPKIQPQQPTDYEAQLQDIYQKGLNQRQNDDENLRGQLTKLGDRPTGLAAMDLSPVAAWVDSATGSNLSQGYKGPIAAKDYDQKKQLLQQAIASNSGKLTDDQLAYLKMKQDARNKDEATQARLQGYAMGLQGRQSAADNKDDRLTNNVYDKFDNDTLLKSYSQRGAQVARGMHQLENPPNGIITTQVLKDITNEIATSLAQGASSADDREKQEFSNLNTKWSSVLSKLHDAPEGVASPELVSYLKANLSNLQSAFKHNASLRAQEIGQGRSYHSKSASDAVKKKVAQYSGQSDSGPKPGDIVDGYRFKGGDPANPASWEAQ